MVPLSKFHSFGNDFLIVESQHLPRLEYQEFSKAICRPHFGVGADGCLIIRRLSSQLFNVRIFNQDGSEAGMSGNGVRCAAAYLHKRKIVESTRVRFQTSSGLKSYELLEAQPPVWRYTSDMGVPSFDPEKIPIEVSRGRRTGNEYELSFADGKVVVTPLSVGNPQCVVFVDDLPGASEVEFMGRALENHPFFPERTNVSFVQVLDHEEIAIKIWERGVGPTSSSGTGSMGAGVAALVSERVFSPVAVRTETGRQIVEWEPPGEVRLTGESRFVADVHFHWKAEQDAQTEVEL